jgi:hypothetical protein
MKRKGYILFLLIVLLASCNIQKRHYQKGFYVSNNGKDQTVSKDSVGLLHLDSVKTKDISFNKNSIYKHHCDTLLLKDGHTILCKIEEISKRTVRFKECKDSVQLTNAIDAELVSSIKFYNGRKKSISDSNVSNKPKENQSLIKGSLVNIGFVFAILALLLEGALLLALFHVMAITPYLAIILAVLNALAAIIALVFGFSSLKEIRKNPEIFKGKKMATWEIVLGLLSLVSWLIILITITII